jgi:hypothetical protein
MKMKSLKKGGEFPEIRVLAPSKGLNTFMSNTDVDDEETPDALNIEYYDKGNPGTRRGTAKVGNEVDSRVRGLKSFYVGAQRFLLRNSGTKLYKLDGTWQEIAGVTFTSDLQTNYVVAKDKIYIHNGTDDMAMFDGTTLSQPNTGVKARFGIFYKGYHIVAGNTDFPSRVYISNPTNPADFTGSTGTATAGAATTLTDSTKSWGVNDFAKMQIVIVEGTGAGQVRTIASNTATAVTVTSAWSTNPSTDSKYEIGSGNWVEIMKGDGDKVTGLGVFQDVLIIFKERSTHQMTFDGDGIPSVATINSGVGCVSYRSISTVENDLFFLSRNGVYVLGNEPNYFNVIRTNELSLRIKPTLDVITPNNLENTSSVYDDNKYMLSIPVGGVTSNNRIVAYDRRYLAWMLWDSMNANCFTEYIDSNNAKHLYFGDDTTGYIWEMYQGYSDDGDAINSYWKSKNFDLEAFDRFKRWFDSTVKLKTVTGVLSLTYTIDGTDVVRTASIGNLSGVSTGFGSGILGLRIFGTGSGEDAGVQTSSNVVKRVKLNRKARTVQLRVATNGVEERFVLEGFGITYIPYSHFVFPSSDRLY